MGLHIHAIAELPSTAERGYYMYLLDYGWNEPISRFLTDNFTKLSEFASQNDAIVIQGIPGYHFEDDVLSWHHINGIPGDEILPAIMITTCHPKFFPKSDDRTYRRGRILFSDKMVLIPLNGTCRDASGVLELIHTIFSDIKSKKPIRDFSIVKTINADKSRMSEILDAVILKPSFMGMGVDLNKVMKDLFRKKTD